MDEKRKVDMSESELSKSLDEALSSHFFGGDGFPKMHADDRLKTLL